jgi:SPP1 gp7 family putative phage head morphogenesis protein
MASNGEDRPRMTDAMMRHQLYIEGVKQALVGLFAPLVLRGMRQDIKTVLLAFGVEYEKLGQVPKGQLEAAIRILRVKQAERFDTFTAQVMSALTALSAADARMTQQILHAVDGQGAAPTTLTAEEKDALWSKTQRATLEATGSTIEGYFARLAASSLLALELAIRRAHASNTVSAAATVAQLLGTVTLNQREGVVTRFIPQAAGAVNTAVQHVVNMAQTAVAKKLYKEYRWVSIIDSVTSKICRARNGKVYTYGDGPMPPAHPNCRSHIEPIYDRTASIPNSYKEWLAAQPSNVQADLGGRKAQTFTVGALTIPQFKDKLSLIIAV